MYRNTACVLCRAVNRFPKHLASFWDYVAQMVGTRSAEECHREHMPQGIVNVRTKSSRKKKKEPVNEPGTHVLHMITSVRLSQVLVVAN